VLAWLVAVLATPDVPHTVLSLFGEQGTAKSTTTKRIVEVVDPSPVPLRKPPRDAESWVTAAQGSWVVGLDNLSTVPDWLSDCLCRASTGDGDVRRQLYTDGGLAVFAFRRCIVINGIDVGALRGDLTDRILHVSLDRIDEAARREDDELDERWRRSYPLILGALLAVVAGVNRVLPFVELGSKPRMADFASLLAAVDQLQGTAGLDRYLEQGKVMAADSLSADPLLIAMLGAELEFNGTAAELLEELKPEDERRPPRDWPKNPRAVTGILKRHAPALRKLGWTVEDSQDQHTKVTVWQLIHPEKACKSDPQHPQHPQDGSESAGSAGHAGHAGNKYGQSQDDEPTNGHRKCTGRWEACTNDNCLTFHACVLADTGGA
jgi:hypothetical protein